METNDAVNLNDMIKTRKPQYHLQHNMSSGDPKQNTEDIFIDITPGTSKSCENPMVTNLGEKLLNTETSDGSCADISTLRSIESFVCRICHNSENPERLVSPCLCKGSLTYVHIHCLERWISTSYSTTCELCQFQYNTQQTLRYAFFQSLRIWYSRSMSRRTLQEDCQIFSLLTLIAFGIIGTLLVSVQYYIMQGHVTGFGRLWTKGWLIFFLLTTLVVYLVNVYMIAKSQLTPWYRWWQSARDIRLILENHKPFKLCQKNQNQMQSESTASINQNAKSTCYHHQQHQNIFEGSHPLQPENDTTCQNIEQSLQQTGIAITANDLNNNLLMNLPVNCDNARNNILTETTSNHALATIATPGNNAIPMQHCYDV